jgi:hypothetical protein
LTTTTGAAKESVVVNKRIPATESQRWVMKSYPTCSFALRCTCDAQRFPESREKRVTEGQP